MKPKGPKKKEYKTKTMSEEAADISKKQKVSIPQSPDEEWPEAWVMVEGEIDDQKKENRQEPNAKVTAEGMRKLGISYWKMDADAFEYPVKSVPWDPKDAMNPTPQGHTMQPARACAKRRLCNNHKQKPNP